MKKSLLEQYIKEFLGAYSEEKGLLASTVENKSIGLDVFMRFVGERDVTVSLIREYLSYRRKKLMTSSLRCEIKNLRALGNFLVKRRYVTQEENWSDQLVMPKYIKQPLQVPDQETMERVIIEGTTPRKGENEPCRKAKAETRNALMFTLRHGIRIGELLSLETSQVSLDTDTPTFTFRRKGGKVMTLPVTTDMVPMLKKRCRGARTHIFDVAKGTLNKALHRGAKKLNLVESVHFHTLRHCFATELLKQGVPIEKVSALLGHSNIQLTYSTYQHLIPSDLQIHLAKQSVVRERLPAKAVFDTVIEAVKQTGVLKDIRFSHEIKKEGSQLVITIACSPTNT